MVNYEKEYEEAVELFDGRDILAIPTEEVKEFTGETRYRSKTVRLSIYYELWKCRNDQEYFQHLEKRNIRNIWYNHLKKLLQKRGDETQYTEEYNKGKHTDPWGRSRTKMLSSELSSMVLEGFCTYGEMKIEDMEKPKIRPAEKPYHFGKFDEVVLFVEKAGLFPRMKPLAKMLGFTIECGKGQQATSAIEGLINYLQKGKEYLVFVLTDFDYWGFEIMRSLEERSNILGINAEFKRIGLWKDQIPEEEWEAKWYRPKIPSKRKKKRRKAVLEWLDQYGIENEYGFELEAITDPRELRKLVANAVYEYCDVKKLYKHFLEQALENLDLQYYNPIQDETLISWGTGIEEGMARKLAGKNKKVREIKDRLEELREKVSENEDLKKLEKDLKKLQEKIEEKEKEVKEELGIPDKKQELKDEWEEKKNEYRDKVKEKIEELDDREIPEEWLKEQIMKGVANLNPKEYTDPEDLIQKVIDEFEEELVE